jgi:Carboxypeptidase regulatory-like domain
MGVPGCGARADEGGPLNERTTARFGSTCAPWRRPVSGPEPPSPKVGRMRDRHDARASFARSKQNGRGSVRRPSAGIAGLGLVLIVALVGAILLVGPFDNEDARPEEDGARAPAPPQPAGSGSASGAKPLANPGRGRITGYVRDVNGHPVARARVRVGGTRRDTRSNSKGRYVLRVPRRSSALLAEHSAYATQAVGLTRRAGRGHRIDFSLAATRFERAPAPNSADSLIFWGDCSRVAELSAGELNRLVAGGVDGFVCVAGRLHTMGGLAHFTGNVSASLDGADYELQRRLRGSAVVKLAGDGRLRLYLGFKTADYFNPRTPFKEWFDDAEWSRSVLKPVRELAAAARSLGFAGVAVDQEPYPGKDGATASWSWNYPGNNRSEQEVRAQVERRGRQLMTAMLAGYPGLELVAYHTRIAGTWADKVQEVVNDQFGAYRDDVHIDLWAGLSSVPGYAAIRWFDSIFYKSPHIGGEWSVALEDNANSTYSVLSRRFPNWDYASSRLHVTPFSWISDGPNEGPFDDARAPDEVADQLAAFRDWGTGGMFGNFTYGGPTGFDYEPYADAMRNASTPALVDQEPPELSVTSPAGGGAIDATGDELELAGTAHDNYAIRVVRWYDAKDRFGTAKLTWEAEESLTPDTSWVTRWQIRGVPLSPGINRITVVAEDIKGLATVRRLTVRR